MSRQSRDGDDEGVVEVRIEESLGKALKLRSKQLSQAPAREGTNKQGARLDPSSKRGLMCSYEMCKLVSRRPFAPGCCTVRQLC